VTDLSAEFDRWRQASVRSDVVVERGEEPLLTSIMPIIRLPEEVSFYEYDRENKKFGQALETVPHPHAMHNRLLVSFAAAHEIQAHLPPELTVSLRGTASFATFLEGKVTDPVGPLRRDANAWAVRMLRESFEAHLATRGLLRYLASAGTVMFFPKDLLADDRVYYTNAKGKRTYKQVVARARCSRRTGISACEQSFASAKRPRYGCARTSSYLWTRGYIPRLRTYPGREVPNPLTVEIRRGSADIEQVMRDVMSLTKLNFNGAEFCDGLPVTLRFADLVGEILTAGPITPHAPLPFKFYI
jgi:hypothetical protein